MRRAAVALAAGALACVPALPPRAPGASMAGSPGSPAAGDATALLAEARAHLSRRAQPGEARQAERLFLSAAERDPHDLEGLYGTIQARIWRIDHEPGVDRRAVATSAVDAGQACLDRAPESALCHYALALALGIQARERHATAADGLGRMAEHLRRAAQQDPRLDEGGPDRVLAVLLARAPGWPVGPGDAEGAVEAARRAVRLAPAWPPNLLALAEALLAAGGAEEGRQAARRAVALAHASADPDAAGWEAEGERLLARPSAGGAGRHAP